MYNEQLTVRGLYALICERLKSIGVENSRFEAEQLMQSEGLDRLALITEQNARVTENISSEIMGKLERRLAGEPLQYILGEWEFCGLPFKVGNGVLIPRQDTETLVEVCADFLKDRQTRKTLDLCAGSGCIGIALAKLSGADVICVEKSEQAFGYLKENILLNKVNVSAVLGDALDERTVGGEFDVIVSNPPYLTSADMEALQKEVRFEPETALFGGADGLDFYRRILEIYPKKLKKGGMFAVEIGIDQDEAVCGLFRENGLITRVKKDMCGVKRVIYTFK